MSNGCNTSGKHWAVVLSGGEGQRVRPLVQRWLGRHVPKQYCTFVGTRSMFQHTLSRARMLTDPEHILTVIAPGHRQEVFAQCEERAGQVLVQPRNRDTAAGIFLPLAWIRSRDPDATVVIYPSDHFIYPEERFVAVVEQALGAAEQHPDRLVLLGVRPDHLELEYGWILTGETLDQTGSSAIRTVRAFMEKPSREQAGYAMASGALWNTFVIVARLRTLWTLGHQCFPELMPWFERLSERQDAFTDVEFLEALYRDLPARNFSSGLLQHIPGQAAVIELAGVLWCDWGKPERIVETLRTIGKQPAFPEELLAGPQIRVHSARTGDPVSATAGHEGSGSSHRR